MDLGAPIEDGASNSIPNVRVAWGFDPNGDGYLSTGERLGTSPYRIKPVDQLHINKAQAAADAGRLLYPSKIYTNNFLYAFQNNQGLRGAYNYPGGATLSVNEFKLDHNLGATFNASGVATIDRAEFVPFALSTLPTPSHLVDETAASLTIQQLGPVSKQ